MTEMEEVRRTRRQLVAAALRNVIAEQEMQGVPTKALQADDVLAIAARNHVRAIEALPVERRPKGWTEPAETEAVA